MSATLTDGPMPVLDRIKSAGKILLTGKSATVNPLSKAPEDKSREELVKELTTWALETRTFWQPVFDRIRHEQKFASGKQWPKEYKTQSDNLEPYIGDVVQQLINRKTATLYAKNPTPEAKQRETMPFTVWDENQQSIDGARATVAQAMQLKAQAQALQQAGQQVPPPPPEAERQVADAQAIIADYEKGEMKKALLTKLGRTATLLIKKEWESQQPDLVVSMKQTVTRILTSRVGYIKVMYRREDDSPETVEASMNTLADDLQAMRHALMRMSEPDFDPESAEAEKFKLLAQSTQEAQNPNANTPTDEGVIYDFLPATSVLIDKNCRSLREFVGARRIAHEILMTIEECERKFKISLRDTGAVLYSDDGTQETRKTDYKLKASDDNSLAKNKSKVCVWEFQDKDTGQVLVVCDGVKDFLKEPEPNEPMLKRFWNIVPVVFNCQEVEVNDPDQDVTIFPRSDIRLAMPMQIDINVAGEGLREHRTANRPTWVGVQSKFTSNTGQNDLLKLSSPRPAHTVLMLDSLNPGEKIPDFIQELPKQPIDQAMYSPAPSNQAMMLATGMQAADIGQQRPDEKATGQNIAAQQKATTDSSNIDDLDFALSTLAQMTWEMLIQEMPQAVVKKKVGAGAVWPELSQERLNTMSEIYLSIEAGSSGRPNQMQEVENFKVIAPQLSQYMLASGKDQEPLIKEGVRRLNDKLDVDEFLKVATPQNPNAGGKGASESISIKLGELSPQERAQALAKAGIQAGGEVPQPHQNAATGQSEGKKGRLDASNPEHRKVAQGLLKQSGGDKAKARELAKQQGYQ